MAAVQDIRMYARYMTGLWGYLREPPLTWDAAVDIVRRRLDTREDNFLRVAERGIYDHPTSPYLKLLRHAGCAFSDLRDMIRSRGLEATLRALHDAGVYVDFEEFKGRKAIVRNGLSFPVSGSDFDNPLPLAGYYLESSGSTGASTRTPTDLNFFRDRAPHYLITHAVNGIAGATRAIWRGPLPDSAGLDGILLSARFNHLPQRWFSPVTPSEFHTGFKNRAATAYTMAVARLCGMRLPRMEIVRPDQAIVIARWMADVLRREARCALNASIAANMRVCLAAEEAGFDLAGALFMGAGETPTAAKAQVITRVGARYAPVYWFSEGGQIGTQCTNAPEINDIHLFDDATALIQSPQPVPGTDETVDAFCFTSLLPSAPKLLLNVAIDDYGVVEQRHCGCPLQDIGCTTHLRRIQSASKLTGEGVTLIGSDMVHILHDVLPGRFGGSALDYQLQQEDDADGFTRLSLVVDPKVKLANEDAVISAVLRELEQSNAMANTAQALWAAAKVMRVERRRPFTTSTGKAPPLHVVRRWP
jgi:hypothetical protein